MFIVLINVKIVIINLKIVIFSSKIVIFIQNNPKIVLITGGVVTGGVYNGEITLSIMLEIRGLRTESCRS